MNITLVFCTQAENKTELKKKYEKFCILNSVLPGNIKLAPVFSNKKTLPKIYNSFIETLKDTDEVLVLVHDDLLIKDKDWVKKLEKALTEYDVVGLAGASNPIIRSPCLWHIMCPRDTFRGAVGHVKDDGKNTFVTNFGKQGRVLILDGLFLAFKPRLISNAGVEFDETNPCVAHFYDIDFSLTCNKNKLKLGTTNIEVFHNSPGLKSFTDEWLNGELWFKQKYTDGKY